MRTCRGLRCWVMFFCMVLVQMMSMVPAFASQQTVSVTVTLEENGETRSGITFAVYQVADAVFEGDTSFQLTEDFAASDLSLEAETAEETLQLINALHSYIAASSVVPLVQLRTDEQGICMASDLEQGMYLLIPSNADTYGEISPFLVALPSFDPDGNLQYDAVIVPKYTDLESPTAPPTTAERPPSEEVPILGIEDISPYIGIGLLAVGVILLLMAVILLLRRKS